MSNCQLLRLLFHALALWMSATLLSGCGGNDGSSQGPLDAAYYALLPGLQSSHHPQLKEELARLTSERATPLLLTAPSAPAAQTAATPLVSHHGNAAVALKQLFPADRIEPVLQELERMVPEAIFPVDPVRLRSASAFRRSYDQQRQRYRQALDQPVCSFALDHTQGMLGDLWFMDILWLGNALEAIWAAECVSEDRLEQAVESLGYMLRATQCLAAEAHLATRLQAVQMRYEALLVLEAICQHPAASEQTHSDLLDLLQEQLAAWPEDARAWIGDRAQGIHAYEIIRDGYILSLFKFNELERLRAEIGLTERLVKLTDTIDDDQWFYLRTMRNLIESCKRPYYERQEVLREIQDELAELRDSPQYPWIADRLLLAEFELVHELLAQDRALVEGWALALGVTTRRKPGIGPVHPLTGLPWLARQKETYVIVEEVTIGDGRPVLVPLPAPVTNGV